MTLSLRWPASAGWTRSIRADDVADPGGDRLARALGLVAEQAGLPGQARRGRELAQQRVPFGPGPGGPFRVVPALRLRDVLAQAGQPVSDLPPRGGVEDLVGAQPQVGQPGPARARRGDQLGGRHLASGHGEQHSQVGEALGVPHAHAHAAVGQGPHRAVTGEYPLCDRSLPGGEPGRLGVAGQLGQAERAGLAGDLRERGSGGLAPLWLVQPQPGQLVPAAQGPRHGAEPVVRGDGLLQVAGRGGGPAERGRQHAEVMRDRALERDGHAGNDRLAANGSRAR